MQNEWNLLKLTTRFACTLQVDLTLKLASEWWGAAIPNLTGEPITSFIMVLNFELKRETKKGQCSPQRVRFYSMNLNFQWAAHRGANQCGKRHLLTNVPLTLTWREPAASWPRAKGSVTLASVAEMLFFEFQPMTTKTAWLATWGMC